MEGETDIMLSLGTKGRYLLECEIEYEIDLGTVDIYDCTIWSLIGPKGEEYPGDFIKRWEPEIILAADAAWHESDYEKEILAYHRQMEDELAYRRKRKGSKK